MTDILRNALMNQAYNEPAAKDIEYIKTDFYNEWIQFKYKGRTYTRDLSLTSDNGQIMQGHFHFKNMSLKVIKWLTLEREGTTLSTKIIAC